jgi:hypothetical protein
MLFTFIGEMMEILVFTITNKEERKTAPSTSALKMISFIAS